MLNTPLKIYWPFKPYVITQVWGNPNPAYAQQFNDPNWTQHNGIDANVGRTGDIAYQTQFPVYCPVEGFVVEDISWQPQGGGNQILLTSKDMMFVNGEECTIRMYLCHAKKILVKVGDEPALGQLLMIADNTGFSTGPHTHMGLYRIKVDGGIYVILDTNHAKGSIDPAQFFTHQYAVDVASYKTLLQSGLRYYKYLITGN